MLTALVLLEIGFITFLYITLDHFIYPIIFAIILLYISIPAIETLHKHFFIPKIIAISVIFIIQLIIIATLLVKTLPALAQELQTLIKNIPSIVNFLISSINTATQNWSIDFQIDTSLFEKKTKTLMDNLAKLDTETIVKTLSLAQGTASHILMQTLWIIDLLLIPILFFFISLNYENIIEGIKKYTPIYFRKSITKLLQKSNEIFAGYLRGQVILIITLTLGYCAGFSLIQLPYAITIGIITGVLSFIPYLGTITGATMALTILFAQNSDIFGYLSLAFVFIIIHGLESTILIPGLVGNSVGLTTFTSFLAIIIGATNFGIMGVLFAIPITALLKHIFQEIITIYKQEKIV